MLLEENPMAFIKKNFRNERPVQGRGIHFGRMDIEKVFY
jgi:hypothetical protein